MRTNRARTAPQARPSPVASSVAPAPPDTCRATGTSRRVPKSRPEGQRRAASRRLRSRELRFGHRDEMRATLGTLALNRPDGPFLFILYRGELRHCSCKSRRSLLWAGESRSVKRFVFALCAASRESKFLEYF
ncbi:hypothetical protein PHLGIDRAFT_294579 [Phlebiopsis gigantea 11061_1 CR5-6]|uniref:Uncharacterized protein n=1 Tax=Phlebiopsis gigantea (strain 11061_1 CR5-6) TaxID=745531 RepID=A0A0C3SB83_PHLG1|nr:hypothetical protein PHLGIDRAFT_294579 [Phlebiopsis gigantea 11061_1 CR5-6]